MVNVQPIDSLDDVPCFNLLREGELADLAKDARRVEYSAASIVQIMGEPVKHFGVVLSGRLRAVLDHEDGREFLVHFLQAGDFVGEICEDETPATQTVHAISASQVLMIPMSTMHQLIGVNAQFAKALVLHLQEELASILYRLPSLVFEAATDRVLKYFEQVAIDIGEATEEGWRIEVELSHQVIADSCGLARETVSRGLRSLANKGVLTRAGNQWSLNLFTEY